jgi:GT2 family glycosyltransferase
VANLIWKAFVLNSNAAVHPRTVLGIVTRNRASLLTRSIRSACAQDCPDLQVWVINNGSNDGTADVANRFPTVIWTDWPSNRGYVAARNHFIAQSDAKYFVSLDDDAWFIRGDEVRTGIMFLDSHPDVAAVGFDIVSPDRPQQNERTVAKPAPVFIGCGHILRLAALHQVGSYVSAPGSYGGEEKDLALRLMDAGYQVVTLPGVHVWHDKSEMARNIADQHRSGVCNDFAMTLRRTPLVLLPIALMSKLYQHFRFARAHGLEVPFGNGLQLFIRSLREVWKTRKPVRIATLRAYLKLSQG